MRSTDRVAQEITDLAQIFPLVMRAITARLRQSGCDIMPAHLRLLALLACGSCNLSALAEKQAVSLPTISNSVSVLVERGWVKRVHAPHDRRVVLLELTSDGRAILAKTKEFAALYIAELVAPLSTDDHKALLAGLAVLRRAFSPLVHSADFEPYRGADRLSDF